MKEDQEFRSTETNLKTAIEQHLKIKMPKTRKQWATVNPNAILVPDDCARKLEQCCVTELKKINANGNGTSKTFLDALAIPKGIAVGSTNAFDVGSAFTKINRTDSLAEPPMYSIHHGRVINTRSFGAFIKLPGFRTNGLVHITQVLYGSRVENMADELSIGQKVWVKVIKIKCQPGTRYKLSLSMKVVNQKNGADLDPSHVRGPRHHSALPLYDSQNETPLLYTINTLAAAALQVDLEHSIHVLKHAVSSNPIIVRTFQYGGGKKAFLTRWKTSIKAKFNLTTPPNAYKHKVLVLNFHVKFLKVYLSDLRNKGLNNRYKWIEIEINRVKECIRNSCEKLEKFASGAQRK